VNNNPLHYAGRNNAECRVFFIVVLNVGMMNVVMLNVLMLNVATLNVVLLSALLPVVTIDKK
jgi:hypothetical protein